MTTVLFVLLPGVHLLDLAGPAQAFFTAGDVGHPYDLRYVSALPDAATVTSAQGLPLAVGPDWPALTPDDLVVVPGWRVGEDPRAWPHVGDATRERLRAHHAAGGTVASVCAGSDALGQAGLLDGRRCTTHHAVQDELAARHPRAHVVRDVLFTTDDRVVTSAGIASGIDLSLHLLAVRHGPAVAARVAREMVVYARRNGTEPQASVMLRHRSHLDDTVHRVQDHIDTHFTRTLPLPDLAARAGVAERTLTRLFTRAAGVTPLRYQQSLRVERAEHLIGHGATVEAAAHAVGFRDARMLRRLRTMALPTRPGPPGS
ncbi:GlxA family transcriptional regulator [Promicromonospora thailandica]|uniref:Transcriptional regulator GlxA family, contains an amidase domain and an AraC-type DNA-binding HTH domain n=1 Tax=Promicromonospora thailandica TaxID=765201 RepID=A0A9X2JUN9_9MICO|nr:DJ-1/PfpI family protein [Promicromonospora thailandica]MCP2263223.1 Transcriptional regulator GlxA family, contains an amidase domain and an AraC-type DNA-binding HTH domain [Promicromonospora thailandica]BFF18611.1 DJ-1/PfpI family protein [Promicromonospora thailandica]